MRLNLKHTETEKNCFGVLMITITLTQNIEHAESRIVYSILGQKIQHLGKFLVSFWSFMMYFLPWERDEHTEVKGKCIRVLVKTI